MNPAAPAQKPRRSYQKSGYYTAKGKASRRDDRHIDRRKTEDRNLLRDREAFKKICGRKNYGLKRRKQWENVERLQRVLDRVDPTVFARSSLVNKRRNVIMSMTMDYLTLVKAHQDALNKAFEGLPDAKVNDDPMAKLRRRIKRQSQQNDGPREGLL
jgi:hypothetical protein